MCTQTWIPDGIALDKPNPARIYDYNLGGHHNLEVDRIVAEQINAVCPDMALNAHANRAFLRRAVQFFVSQGIEQFLDVGSGLPTVGNVHEIVQRGNPAAHVVYVDIDPTAVTHANAILADNPNATAIQADARQPDRILGHTEVKRLLDFRRPMGILFLAVLHFVVDDEEATRAVHTLRDAAAPGSYLAISHLSFDEVPRETIEQFQRLGAGSAIPSKARSRAEILPLFDELEWVEPGLVRVPAWRPEGPDDVFLDRPERVLGWAGVGRKPGGPTASPATPAR